jgi:tRNA pseudouridine55 synthase
VDSVYTVDGGLMNGILLVDKPKGWTSHDVVAKVRGTLKQSGGIAKPKVGHTGTLDPLATGLLVLVVGSYTKRAQEFSKLDKTYEVTMKLGETSTTGDAEGKISPYPKPISRLSLVTRLSLAKVLKGFTGDIEQIPPQFSAIKVGGQRAYKLARAGKEVKLEPRNVTVHSIRLTDYSYPIVKFTTEVSSGTYIRSLVEDIGQKLGTGAYMTELKRAEVGQFTLENAVRIDDTNLLQHIFTISRA